MSQLCFYLPPFSSDYSGACSALFELDGTIVVHDGHCCSANYAGFDEPRWFAQKKPIYCSSLREVDAVLGSDDKLKAKVRSVLKDGRKPPFIVLLGSPAPTVIGADLDGIAAELQAETGIDTFGLSTTGVRYYTRGAADACIALLKRYAKTPVTAQAHGNAERRVNILGLTPIDFSDGPNADDVRNFVADAGYSVNCCFSMGSRLGDVARAADADVNLVVAAAGFPVARFMEKRWGIPYVAGTLFGTDRRALADEIANAFGTGDERPADERPATGAPALCSTSASGTSSPDGAAVDNARILIVADQVLACSIRRQLETRFGCPNVAVASFFGLDEQLRRAGDVALSSEKDLVRLLCTGKYGVLVGDPLLERIPGTQSMSLFAIPHVAISSKLFWHDYLRFASEEAENMLGEIANVAAK